MTGIIEENATKTGYTFEGWFDEETAGAQVTHIPSGSTGDITLYARWKVIEYTITYDSGGGTNHTDNPLGYTIETPNITLQEATKTGYSFEGWYDSPAGGNKTTHIAQGSTGNLALSARWTANTFTVTFDAEGGTNPAPSSVKVSYDAPYGDLATTSKEGYSFIGWWTEEGGKGSEIVATSIVAITADQTLYAKWGHTVGDIGPGGGYVFYDKGEYSNGWRFLEAAPAGWSGGDDDPVHYFGYYRPDQNNVKVGTSTEIGNGKSNTDTLVKAMGAQAYQGPSGDITTPYAAKIASDYKNGGIENDVWFLPSRDELNQMYVNLQLKNLGGFSSDPSDTCHYWSSSEATEKFIYDQDFHTGTLGAKLREEQHRVRPVRAF